MTTCAPEMQNLVSKVNTNMIKTCLCVIVMIFRWRRKWRQCDHWCWDQGSVWDALCSGFKQGLNLRAHHWHSGSGARLWDQLKVRSLPCTVRRQFYWDSSLSHGSSSSWAWYIHVPFHRALRLFCFCFFSLFRYLNEKALFSRPTYAALLAVLDNYNRMTGQTEDFTSQQLAEQETFLKETMSNTELGRELFAFLYTKGNCFKV